MTKQEIIKNEKEAQKEYEAKYGMSVHGLFPSLYRERGVPLYTSTPEFKSMLSQERKERLAGKKFILFFAILFFIPYAYFTLTVKYEGPNYSYELLALVAWFIFILNRIWDLACQYYRGEKVTELISKLVGGFVMICMIGSYPAWGIWIIYNLIKS